MVFFLCGIVSVLSDLCTKFMEERHSPPYIAHKGTLTTPKTIDFISFGQIRGKILTNMFRNVYNIKRSDLTSISNEAYYYLYLCQTHHGRVSPMISSLIHLDYNKEMMKYGHLLIDSIQKLNIF